MEKKLMDDILKEVEKLKKLVLESEEYKNFITNRDNLDNNKEINKIIGKIKITQKNLINKQDKEEDTLEEEIKLKSLYNELDNYDEYKKYIESARVLNNIITGIQKKFEDYFNTLIM